MVTSNGKATGRITQVIGSTFDVEFPEHQLPTIYNAVKIDSNFKGVKLHLTGEVQQHLGGGRVRWAAGKFGSPEIRQDFMGLSRWDPFPVIEGDVGLGERPWLEERGA